MAKYKKVDTDLKFVDREKEVEKFWNEEDGMGVVEIVLITVVLIGLVIIFITPPIASEP